MFYFPFYTFTIAYILFLIGAYHAFRYNSPKRSVIILSIAILLDMFSAFCSTIGFLTPKISTGLGTNFYMILLWIFGLLYYITFILSFIPYKKGNLNLHQRMILIIAIFGFLANQFWFQGIVELLLPFKPAIP